VKVISSIRPMAVAAIKSLFTDVRYRKPVPSVLMAASSGGKSTA